MIAQHSSNSNEHFTPLDIVERARHLMEGIDLDPASCEEANKTVRAYSYFTKETDGLNNSHQWRGRVFLNPPGGKLRFTDGKWIPVPKNENGNIMGPGKSSMDIWWQELANQYESNLITQGFFVAFTLEILRGSQFGIPVQRYFRCYPRERMKFSGAKSPTHANALIWLPPKHERNFTKFRNLFEEIGYCEPGS